ncbi:ABC transporter permease [Sporomusa acidovorans]|uniref:Transport permease protein n=1 Tax=Sporomusa acidovorans (strain ATCC 49682 / DSM 3132 / Mol) TaxID=1123286 RepID=A0ABZ3J4G6_SPOA4|nr:ABC transporter permease [Sporomusa acidovorans]OZC16395.1 inner membrane transport permease YbhS [Sporomusa acidovorans DSM 3132]SDF00096.1 ABC-2 type transport system permease protein [Sporomusa acidovorans]
MIRLRALLIKEFIQMRRDRLTFAMMVGLPIVQLLLFGFAINTDVKHLSTIVFDQSLQQEGRELLSAFQASEYFSINYAAKNYQEVTEAVESGKAKVGVIIPPDYTDNLKHGRSAAVQVIVDASDSMAASSAISSAQLIGQIRSQEILIKRMQGSLGKQLISPIDIRIRAWYNPDFISAFYMVPGILGVVLTMTMVMITSMAIVRERERGTMEQLIVTPMKSHELMLGKIIPYIFVGYVQATLALIVGALVFDVPMRGSIGLLYGLTTLFIIASLSLGVLISTIAKTQMQAMQMSFFVFLPSVLLSGFMFPREAMPQIFYYLGQLLPLTFYLEILRGIVLKGIGLNLLWSQVFALVVYILAALSISIIKFQKKIA